MLGSISVCVLAIRAPEVTVHGGPPLINTQDASVGTVIDRDTIDQMALNGQGIQTLIELPPGVVAIPVVTATFGQFVVNGQRNNTSYFNVDGVSANFAVLGAATFSVFTFPSGIQTGSPTIPASNFLGTFSNLVSPDALQQFRIQTSTFAPRVRAFARGAQIGMITRSGTNTLHTDSLFEYLRIDRMDTSDWFRERVRNRGKPPLRFSTTSEELFGGPPGIPHLYNRHDRTFALVTASPVPTLAAPECAASSRCVA